MQSAQRLVAGVLGRAVAMVCMVFAANAGAEPTQAVLTIGAQTPTSDRSAIPGAIPGDGVPGDPRFTNFNNRIQRSPTSNLWLIVATTNLTPAAADQVLVIGSGREIVGGVVAAREGTTTTREGDLLNFSRLDTPRINDSGRWAMAYRLNVTGASAIDERVVRYDGESLNTVFRSGDVIPADTQQTFGGSFTGANIINSGQVGFQATVGLVTGTNDSVFSADGGTLLINVGVDAPTGQAGGAATTWSDVDPGAFWQSADGAHWLALGELGFDTTVDRVVVVDDGVVVQKGTSLPGFAALVSTITDAFMESNGDWFARGTNGDGVGWIVRNGAVIAATGRAVVPGSAELWESFRDVKGNNAGDFVINGNTANTDTLVDDVLVLNGVRVIARESDPIDVDADGVFEGDLFLHLVQDRGVLNNDGYFYFASRLKSLPGATTGAGGSNNASLLRVMACPADVNGSGAVSPQDIFDFIDLYFANDVRADFNRGGAVTVQDIFDFLDRFFDGC